MWRSELVELVALDVDGRRWALPLAVVERVVATVAVAPLPGAPRGVRGAINVAGEAVPVLDLDARMGGEPPDRGLGGRLVLARTSRRRVAVAVDLVLPVIRVERAAITPPGEGSRAELAGVVALPDGVLAIYDLDAFLSASDEALLAAALEGAER